MEALVIGGSGFLGSEICKVLVHQGFKVKSLQRHSSDKLIELGVSQYLGSVEDEILVEKAVNQSDVVFFCGGIVDYRGSSQDHFNINYGGCVNAVRASLRNKVKAFILTSTPSVFLNPKGIHGLSEYELSYSTIDEPYVQSKIAAEKMLLTQHPSHLPFVILRPHQIWSEDNNKFTSELLDGHSQLRIIGDGKNRVDSIHISDAVRAHLLAMCHLLRDPHSISGRDYNLSSSRPFLLWEEINKFYMNKGLSPIRKKISPTLARLFNSSPLRKIKTRNRVSEYLLIQLSVDRWFDCTRAQRELSFQCKRFQ